MIAVVGRNGAVARVSNARSVVQSPRGSVVVVLKLRVLEKDLPEAGES